MKLTPRIISETAAFDIPHDINMKNDDDEAMAPPKPTMIIASPTPSEKAASIPTTLARFITTASLEESPPPKNVVSKKQKIDKKEKDENDYILENNSKVLTLTNYSYPETITEQCFQQLSTRGRSDLIIKIKEYMKQEQEFRTEYHGNSTMYTNWFWLHEDEKDSVPINNLTVQKIKHSYTVKYERLALAKEWIEDLCETATYGRYPINHFMCLLLKEMDRYLYSVPVENLKDNVGILKKELHKRFTENCKLLKSKQREYDDSYGRDELYNKEIQIHLQNIYHFN